jgi:hypothetical protein
MGGPHLCRGRGHWIFKALLPRGPMVSTISELASIQLRPVDLDSYTVSDTD